MNLLQCRDYHNNHHQSEQKSFKIQTYDENDVNKALVCLLNAIVRVRMPRFFSEQKHNKKSLPDKLFNKPTSSTKIEISPLSPIYIYKALR